jgi:uroporphyrinogen-III synthase
MSSLPLAGRTVVVTRPRAQAEGLAARIAAAGGEALLFPLLEIAQVADPAPLAACAAALESYHLLVFISPNAVAYSLPTLLAGRSSWPASVQTAAVGGSTVAALASHGVGPVVAPSERFDSEALLEQPALQPEAVAGKRIALIRGDGGRELLGDTLRQRGATVDAIPCYRRLPPVLPATVLSERWGSGRLDAITVSSSEGLRYLVDLLDADGRAALATTPVFVPHQRIADNAAALGLNRVILTGPADDGIVAGLCAYNWP